MKIAIVGQGGHSRVIQELITFEGKYEIVAYLDDKYKELTREKGIFTGPISSAKVIIDMFQEIKFFIAIGHNPIRRLIRNRLKLSAEKYATLVHPSANVSPSAKIGFGTVVMARSVINANSTIGDHSIINTGSVVEHDNRIGNFVHISPNSTLTGSVTINDGAHVGAGATIIPNMDIGEWSIIGAGASVIHSIPPFRTAVGVPAMVKNNPELRALQ